MADINTTITDQISRLDGAAKIIKQKTVELGLSKNDTLDGAGVISLGDSADVLTLSKVENTQFLLLLSCHLQILLLKYCLKGMKYLQFYYL